jgi:hypothetical protein
MLVLKKILCGLQISYAYKNSYFNHDIMIDNGTNHYLERGECAIVCHNNSNDPVYVKICPMMLVSNDNMQWHKFIYCDLFIYKMPMHRKKVRLHCYCFYVLSCSLSCFILISILMELKTTWDPGKKCMEHFPRIRREQRIIHFFPLLKWITLVHAAPPYYILFCSPCLCLSIIIHNTSLQESSNLP